MRKGTRTRVVAGGVAALWLAGMAAPATAQEAGNDVEQLLDNAPTAVEELANGVEETASTAAETQSAVETSGALGEALASSGGALVAGTEQLGALGLGFEVINQGAQQALAPVLEAIDDPETAGDLLDPEDLATIADRAGAFSQSEVDALITATPALLRGELAQGSLQHLLVPAIENLQVLFAGTAYENAPQPAAAVALVLVFGFGGDIEEAQESLAPAFEALEPITGPVIEALESQQE